MGPWALGCLGHLGHLVVLNLSNQVSTEHSAVCLALSESQVVEEK